MLATAVAAVASAFPVEISHAHHGATIATQREIHRQAIGRLLAHAHELAGLAVSLHDRTLQRNQTLHYETVSYELDIARREVARDIWSQKNHLIQTLMVINTVMVISIYSLLVQGYAPAGPDLLEAHNTAYTVMCCFAVACHVASVYVAFKLNARAIQFQMHNPTARYRPCGLAHVDFGSFFDCHCAAMESFAFHLFYLGTSCSLVTCVLFVVIVDIGRSQRNAAIPAATAVVACAGVVASVVLYLRR